MESIDKVKSWSDSIYELALMFVFIPKTLIRIITKPKWITDYVHSQMTTEEGKKRFDEHSSPIVLWLVTGVLSYFVVIDFMVKGFAEEKILEVYKSIGTVSLIGSLSVYLICLPLSCAFVVHWFKYKNIDKTNFKSSFYIQCYCFAIVQLFYVPGLFYIFTNHKSSWMLIGVFSILLSFGWFFYTEYLIVKSELKCSLLKMFLVFVAMYFVSFFFIAISTGLFFILNIDSIVKLVDFILKGNVISDSLRNDTIILP